MKRKVLSRRQFLERMGTLAGLGAAYYGMANSGFLPLVQAYTGPPGFDQHSGEGLHVVILGAGIGGLCAAYLLRNTNFKVTIIEPNPDVGGRCLTLRRGDMVKEEGADRRGRPFRPQTCDFDKGPDFYFNAGPGRIPQSHTAILHYCKKLKTRLKIPRT
jgi:monoamine oxidase